MSYVARKAGASLGAGIAVVVIAGLISVGPWVLGAHIAADHGMAKGSAGYDAVGWCFEAVYLVLVGAVAAASVRSSRRRASALAERQAAVRGRLSRPADMVFTHDGCPVAHRSYDAAARCQKGR